MTDNTEPARAAASDSKRSLPGRKLGKLVKLLQRKNGATLEQMVAATSWQPHSVRGALSGALKKRGYAVGSLKEGEKRIYRLTAIGQEVQG